MSMFGFATITQASFSRGGNVLTIEVNVRVNSTGWSVDHEVTRNKRGHVNSVTLTPKPPTGISGPGFPSGGVNFTVKVRGPFAKTVQVGAAGGNTLKLRS